jgi:hypothetical protein
MPEVGFVPDSAPRRVAIVLACFPAAQSMIWRSPNLELLLRPTSAQSGIAPPEARAHLAVSRPSAYVRLRLPFQSVIATHASKRSAGVSKPSVLRGRPLSCRAIARTHSLERQSKYVHRKVAAKFPRTCCGLGKPNFRSLGYRSRSAYCRLKEVLECLPSCCVTTEGATGIEYSLRL